MIGFIILKLTDIHGMVISLLFLQVHSSKRIGLLLTALKQLFGYDNTKYIWTAKDGVIAICGDLLLIRKDKLSIKECLYQHTEKTLNIIQKISIISIIWETLCIFAAEINTPAYEHA